MLKKEYIDPSDREIHYNAFVKNLKYINELNVVSPEITFCITQFADLTDEERKRS